jgi:uncharacterized protein YlxW (UPF0749 family)
MECFFIINTYYEYQESRTWFQYFTGEPILSYKIFHCKKPIHTQTIKDSWKLIEQQNLFQEIRRQNIQIRILKNKIDELENKLKNENEKESDRESDADIVDLSK